MIAYLRRRGNASSRTAQRRGGWEDIERKVDVIGPLVSILLGITLAGLTYGLLVGHFGWIVGAVAAVAVFVGLRLLTGTMFRR